MGAVVQRCRALLEEFGPSACVILAQGAQAAEDPEILSVVTAAHDTVLRTHRWALTRLKTTAPQVLTGP